MTTQGITLELESRELRGKKVKKLRREGIIPVHLYGPGETPRSLQCQSQKLIQVLSAAGGNTAITVSIHGEPGNKLAFAREIQWDPKRDSIFHVAAHLTGSIMQTQARLNLGGRRHACTS